MQITPRKKGIDHVLTYCTACVEEQQWRLTLLFVWHRKKIMYQTVPQRKTSTFIYVTAGKT